MREVEGSFVLLLVDVTELVFFLSTSADAEEKTVIWPPADFLGDAKRLSGKMCSKLLQENGLGGGGGGTNNNHEKLCPTWVITTIGNHSLHLKTKAFTYHRGHFHRS